MDERVYSIEESIYYFPLPLLNITNKRILSSIDEYLPYSTGFEIECHMNKDTFDIDKFKDIPNIIEVNCDSSEQRFRIPTGLNGLVCLYEICNQLKKNSLLNPGSGIHYHVDMTDCYDVLTEEVIKDNGEWILTELDTWEYKGTYNSRNCNFSSSHHWLRFQECFKTGEFRIGEMSFDYEVLVKRIIHANKIIRRLKDAVSGSKEEYRIKQLEEELKQLQVVDVSTEIPQEEMKRIIKKRNIKLYE